MAKGLRTRSAGVGLGTLIVAAALLIHACGAEGAQQPAPRARTVDVAAIAERDLVAAVLDECHGPLRGKVDSIAARVRPAGSTEVRLQAILPDKLRVLDASGIHHLLTGETVFRLGDAAAQEAAPAAAARVRLLRTLLDAATFGPLHRATGCRRLGPHEFELTQPDGSLCKLRLRDHSLLPDSFASSAGEVRVVDYLRTPTTWIAKVLELDGLGRCDVFLEQGGIDWAPDFFAPPTAAKGNGAKGENRPRTLMTAPGAVAESRSPVPVSVETKATRWVCLVDPGTWVARVAAYRPVHAELERQKQLIAGFPIYWQQDGKAWFAAPFRQRPNGPALEAPKDWQLREVPAGSCLEVWPPGDSLEQKLAAGERLLREALGAKRLSPAGPVQTQFYLHLQDGEPEPEKRASAVVRMAVPVR